MGPCKLEFMLTVVLLSPHWASNARIQKAANNSSAMHQGESDHTAVTLLQQALTTAGFSMPSGADGKFGPQTAKAIVEAETHFGFKTDIGIAGREVLGSLDLALRGWKPLAGAHWGGLLAKTVLPLAQTKVQAAINALRDVQNMLRFGAFDFVTADGTTMVALKTHFKLVPPGGTKLAREDFISRSTIDPLMTNFSGIQRTLSSASMIRHSICTLGLDVAAEAPFGGPVIFGPPFSDFQLSPVDVTNIDVTGPNSLAAIMMHEATHVIDSVSGSNAMHISEFDIAYETQTAGNARHNPSAFATFAAHIHAGADRPRAQRFGLGAGRPL